MAGRWLVGSDIGIPPDIDEPSSRVKHRKRQVAAEAVAVIDIKYGRPRFSAAVHATNRLNLFEVQGERVPIDVRCTGYGTCNADRILIDLQQIADVLSRREGIVGIGGVFTVFASERRVAGQTQDVDADCGIADIGVSNCRPRHFVPLLEPDAEFITAGRFACSYLGGIAEIGLVLWLRRGCIVLRLASHANVILRQRSDGLPREAWQHDPHAGILGILRVKIGTENGVLCE